MGAEKSIKEYVVIAFLLLGALFGMNIMSFIFGNLGPSAAGLTAGTQAYNTSLQIQNNSLNGINTYSANSSSQFNVVSIAITLILLIGVFLVFWKIFVDNKAKKQKAMGYGGNFQ